MRFVEPVWLWVGVAAVFACAALMVWSERRRGRALRSLIAAERVTALTSSLSPARRRLKQACLLVATFCAFAALARPQWGFREEQRRVRGRDLLLAVDTSKSMLAMDLSPTRLSRAKLAIEDLVARAQGDRLGLVAFAGDAFLQTPLTHDRAAFADALSALDPSIIPVPGTDIERAITVAERAFASGAEARKVLVLLTDGEDLEGGALEAARRGAEHGLVIHTVGIGTSEGSELAVRDERGRPQLVRDAEGAIVRSRLDEGLLRKVAEVTGGSYHALGADGKGLTQLYEEVFAGASAEAEREQTERVYHERYQWPLALALALALLEWWLGERRRTRARPRLAPAAAALWLCVAPSFARADEGTPVQAYNQAAEQYRKGEYEQAAEHYRKALDTRDLKLQQRAYYDLGNAQYRRGQAKVESDRAQAMADYQQAVAAYDAALSLNAEDADARFNREFVQKKLAELQQSEPPPQPQQQDDEQDGQSGAGQQDGKQDGQSGAGQQDGKQDGQSGAGQQDGQRESGEQGGQSGDARDDRGQGSAQGGGAERDAERGEDQGDAAGKGGAPEEKSGEKGEQQSAASGAEGKDGQQGEAQGAQPARGGEADDARGADPQGAGQPQPGAAGQRGDAEGTAAGSVATGELTHAQAEQLLDALRGELRQLPSRHGERGRARGDAPSGKDW